MKHSFSIFVLFVAFSSSFLACGTPPSNTDAPTQEPKTEVYTEKSPSEKTDPKDASTEKTPEPTPEKHTETLPEPIVESKPENIEPIAETTPEPTPTQCQPSEACNTLLDQDGKCPGKCIPQSNQLSCRGTVLNGLCYRKPPSLSNPTRTINGLTFKPDPIPTLFQQGTTHTFTIHVTNTLSTNNSMPVSYSVSSDWNLIEASFEKLSKIDFAPNETKTLTMKLLAAKANIFPKQLSSGNMIITFTFERDTFTLSSVIGFPPAGNLACGKNYFPATYCPSQPCSDNRAHYFRAKCCQAVFYPGAKCCNSSDCQGGGCFNGQCVKIDRTSLANTFATGHQRMLLVLSDFSDQTHDPSKICTNRFNDLKTRLKIDEFEAYFQKLSQQYTGTPGPKHQWTILSGINTADFNPQGKRDLDSMHRALEKFLLDKGCIKGPNEFDKKALFTPLAELGGFTGRASIGGRMLMKTIDMYLFAHELTHTYGASDLYLDLGGSLQYYFDLMGNSLGNRGIPEFGVSWGELLWGDSNQNGVIDVYEFATYPDSLVATDQKAQLSPKNTIEVKASVSAIENGVSKRINLRNITIELPDFNVSTQTTSGNIVVFDSKQVDLDAIRKKGSVKIRVIASYHFTQKNFERKEIKLSSDKDVTLTP